MAEQEELDEVLQELEARQASELEALCKRNDGLCQNLQSQHAAERQQKMHKILHKAKHLCDIAHNQHKILHQERAAFDAEKAMVCTPGPLSDVIELNVGGVYMTTTRKTLTQVEGSMLAAMFSERWDGCHKLDKEGRIFLDDNPGYFAKILQYLRSKGIEQAQRSELQIPLPKVDTDSSNDFNTLLCHLGLCPEIEKEHSGCESSAKVDTIQEERKVGFLKQCHLFHYRRLGQNI